MVGSLEYKPRAILRGFPLVTFVTIVAKTEILLTGNEYLCIIPGENDGIFYLIRMQSMYTVCAVQEPFANISS